MKRKLRNIFGRLLPIFLAVSLALMSCACLLLAAHVCEDPAVCPYCLLLALRRQLFLPALAGACALLGRALCVAGRQGCGPRFRWPRTLVSLCIQLND